MDYPGIYYDRWYDFIYPFSTFCINMDFQRILKSKIATGGLTIVLALILIGSVKLFAQKYEVSREMQKLQQRADEIRQDNAKLAELSNYYKTDEYAAKAARDKLSLKKEGEYVVSVPTKQVEEQPENQHQELTIPQKWRQYLFGTK